MQQSFFFLNHRCKKRWHMKYSLFSAHKLTSVFGMCSNLLLLEILSLPLWMSWVCVLGKVLNDYRCRWGKTVRQKSPHISSRIFCRHTSSLLVPIWWTMAEIQVRAHLPKQIWTLWTVSLGSHYTIWTANL